MARKYHWQKYGSYLFVEKDPAIDGLRTALQDEFGGRLTRKQLKIVENNGGPKVGTTANWFFGDTKRPQNAGLEAAGRSIGYHRPWTRMPKEDYIKIQKRTAKTRAKNKPNGHAKNGR